MGWKKKQSSKNEKINIELSNKHNEKRLLLFIVLLVFGLGMIGYGLFTVLNTDPGWREIQANKTSELNCSEEFVFMYNLGASGLSATEENKKITALYSEATMKAYQLFTNYNAYEDIHNIYYINRHPNEEIEVDEVLYQAFETIQKFRNRNIYLAPVSMQYDDLFYITDESELIYYDPYSNEEIAVFYREVAAFASNPEAVDIELLGDNKVKLLVSEDYLQYAEENAITDFIDFFWMKNAFIIDYLAEVMISNGYTLGTISSFDGFCRNLDESKTPYSFNIYDKLEDKIYIAATMNYSGAQSIVFLRNYVLNEQDAGYYYELSSGEVRTSYLDVTDGMCKSAANNLVSYSEEKGCAEILLSMIPIYITEEFDEQAVAALTEEEIYSVYCKSSVIYYNDSTMQLSDLYKNENINYTTSLMEE